MFGMEFQREMLYLFPASLSPTARPFPVAEPSGSPIVGALLPAVPLRTDELLVSTTVPRTSAAARLPENRVAFPLDFPGDDDNKKCNYIM